MLYRARQSVKNTINNITTFSLQGIVNAAIDAGLAYYDIDPNGRLRLTIKRVANQAVRYASGGSIDGLYKAESSGGSSGYAQSRARTIGTDGGTAITARKTGDNPTNRGLESIGVPGGGSLYASFGPIPGGAFGRGVMDAFTYGGYPGWDINGERYTDEQLREGLKTYKTQKREHKYRKQLKPVQPKDPGGAAQKGWTPYSRYLDMLHMIEDQGLRHK